jgi:hypothetical protein
LATKELAVASDSAPSHTSFFTRECLTKINMTVVSHPPYISLFPRLKIKLKGHHFDTIEVIEAESQAVLNTLTNTTSRMHLKAWQKCWEQCLRAEGDATARVMVAGRSKVSFWPDGSTSPGNYEWLFV